MIIGRDKKLVGKLAHDYFTQVSINAHLTAEIKALSETEDRLRDINEELRHDISDLEENVAEMRDELRYWKDRCEKYASDERAIKEAEYRQHDEELIDEVFDKLEPAYAEADPFYITKHEQTPQEMFDECLVDTAYKILDSNYSNKYERARDLFLMVQDKEIQRVGLNGVLTRMVDDYSR